jgi:integrin beta 3
MTASDLADVMKGIAPVIKEFQATSIAQLKAEWATERQAFMDLIAGLESRLALAEARPLLAGPKGEKGDRGDTGDPGRDGLTVKGDKGDPGDPGVAGLSVQGERGDQGDPGLNGKDGLNGRDGMDGAHGQKGADGISVTHALLDADGHLVLTLSDGSRKAVGPIVGKAGQDGLNGKDGAPGRDGLPGVPGRPGEGRDGIDGKPGAPGLHGKAGQDGVNGKDGADGLGFDDLDLNFDTQAGWLLRFHRGQKFKVFPLPIPFDAGVWQAGKDYPAGAGVTFKGAYWIAQKATKVRPGDDTAPSRDWRLAVKRGEDGRPGKDGKDGGE